MQQKRTLRFRLSCSCYLDAIRARFGAEIDLNGPEPSTSGREKRAAVACPFLFAAPLSVQ